MDAGSTEQMVFKKNYSLHMYTEMGHTKLYGSDQNMLNDCFKLKTNACLCEERIRESFAAGPAWLIQVQLIL